MKSPEEQGWERSRGGRGAERSEPRTDKKQEQVGLRRGRGCPKNPLKASRGGHAGEGAGHSLFTYQVQAKEKRGIEIHVLLIPKNVLAKN